MGDETIVYKHIKNILLFVMTVAFVGILSGCSTQFSSIEVRTTLTIDKNFDGSRVMSGEIPAAIYKNLFNNSTDEIEAVISKYCPGDMYCVASVAADGGAVIEMHIDFASKSEYTQKIQNICKSEDGSSDITPVTDFEYANTILKKGYTLEENFTSLDLFSWLANALITEYPSLGSHAAEDIFHLGETTVILEGETLETGDKISVSSLESNTFSSISVKTIVNTEKTFDVEVTYIVSDATVNKLGDKLKTLMDKMIPDGGELTESSGDTGRKYTLKVHAADTEALVTCMNKALHVNNTVFEMTEEGDEDALTGRKYINIYFDGSYFLDFASQGTSMTYSVEVPADYNIESCVSTYNYMEDYSTTYTTDTCNITVTLNSSDQIMIALGFPINIQEIDVMTDIRSASSMERTFSIVLDREAQALIGENIRGKFNTAAQSFEDGRIEVTEEASDDGATAYIIVLHAGSNEELSQLTCAVLGNDFADTESTPSVLSGGNVVKSTPWRIYTSYEDTINFSNFLNGSQVENGITYSFRYPPNYKAAYTEKGTYDAAAAEGNTLSFNTFNRVMTVRSEAEKLNVEGIILIGICIISLLIVVVAASMNLGHIAYWIQHKKFNFEDGTVFDKKNVRRMAGAMIAVVCLCYTFLRLLLKIY